MSDFYQNGIISTLHNLRTRSVEQLESDLQKFSKSRPMTLVLPCLFSELEKPALQLIIDELKKIKINEYSNSIQFGNNFLILKIEDKKTTKIQADKDKILEKMIIFEKNKQLNQFSNIYFNKIKINYKLNEN